ncbi:MAG: sugar phosphate isomerase/epimerase family protein [Candidatus Zixiibacteriota bacterium]
MAKNYKFGISTTVDYSVDIFTQFDIFSKIGIDFISISARPEHCGFLNPDTFKKVLLRAKELSFFIESAHAPFWEGYDPAALDKSNRGAAIQKLVEYMGFAAEYDIPIAIVHPHYYFSDSRDACLERAAESIDKILSLKPRNIKMVIENLPTAKGSWICEKLLERFGDDKIGFCYDSSHENMSGAPFHLLSRFYDRLTTTHLSDNHGVSDEHLVPGDGTIDWAEMRRYLDKSPINNILFEVGTGEKLVEPVEQFIRRAGEAGRRFFGRSEGPVE